MSAAHSPSVARRGAAAAWAASRRSVSKKARFQALYQDGPALQPSGLVLRGRGHHLGLKCPSDLYRVLI